MKAKFLIFLYFFYIHFANSQVSVNDIITQTQYRFAPDKRVVIFKIGVEEG